MGAAIKAVFFDLDNTLVDFMAMKKASCAAAVSAMIDAGVQLDKEQAWRVLFELYGKHGIEYSRIFQRFLEKINQRVDYKILAAGIVAYRKAQQSLLQPYPNAVRTLLALKKRGLLLAIVTDAPRLKAWMRLTELGLQDFFDAVVAYGDVKERKPSRMPFRRALNALGLRAGEVLMVGDWPEKDIKGAQKLGMKTCFARYGWQFDGVAPRTTADHEIDGLEELVNVVGGQGQDMG